MKEEIVRRLVIKSFHIETAENSGKPFIGKGVLGVPPLPPLSSELIREAKMDIIHPGDPDRYVNTIMDIIPISVKVLGDLGEGITHTLTGVYVMVTGADEDGRQMHEFGSSEGMLSEQMVRGMAGTPGEDDLILHLDYLVQGGLPFDRQLPLAVFKEADRFIQLIRDELRDCDGTKASEVHEYFDKIRPEGLKVVIIKQIAGQGAMYDNMLFSTEPSGADGKSIIDVGNMPVLLSPNEYRDGALRSMV